MCQYGSYISNRLGWDTSENGHKIGHQCVCQYGSYTFKRLGWDTSEDGHKIGHQCVSVW